MRTAVLARLQQLGLFAELSSHIQIRLVMLGRVRTFEAGWVLFRQDEPYDHLVILLGGQFSVDWDASDAAPSRSGTELEPGSIVGNGDLAPGRISRATVTAIGTVDVLQLDYLALTLSAAPYPKAMPALRAAVRASLIDISALAARDRNAAQPTRPAPA